MAQCETPRKTLAPLAVEDTVRSRPSANHGGNQVRRPDPGRLFSTAGRHKRLSCKLPHQRERTHPPPTPSSLGRRPRSPGFRDCSQGAGRSAGGGVASRWPHPVAHPQCTLRAGLRPGEGGWARWELGGLHQCAQPQGTLWPPPPKRPFRLCVPDTRFIGSSLQPPWQAAHVLARGNLRAAGKSNSINGLLGPAH